MNSVRMNAMIVGVLFIIGTVSGILIVAIHSSPILDAPDSSDAALRHTRRAR